MERFLCSKSILLERLRVQKMSPPRKSEFPKNVIFPRENVIFYKIDDFCSAVEIEEKHEKNDKKKHFKINVCFHMHFSWILEPTWVDFGSQVEPQERDRPQHFSK